MKSAVDYRDLSTDQLIARLQIADGENKRLNEANTYLHRMIETLRDQGWATPRPIHRDVNIRDYPMDHGRHDPAARTDLAKKVAEANERADHWRKKYMDLLDSTGRNR
jgi:hypothetical protein